MLHKLTSAYTAIVEFTISIKQLNFTIANNFLDGLL